MPPTQPHRWDVTPEEAIAIQHRLAERVERTPHLGEVRIIAGVDMSAKDVARAAVVLLSYPELETIEIARAERPLVFPYVPGLLSFREGPAVLAAFDQLSRRPDLVMFDGQGIAHPRRLGIGAHMGVLLNLPSLGVAKSILTGHGPEPGPNPGDWTPLTHKGEVIGAILRTKPNVKPVYISIGHRLDLPTAIHWVTAVCRGYRLPEPTRRAHNAAATAE
ncbi:MAG TPA: deoxyribonuclease V [Chloroflexia bacterium]|nr:deoxyribonuclease V [Chloroflexia bacterium]